MAQSNILLAFRARLRSRGYTDIRISIAHSPTTAEIACDPYGNMLYMVSCTEPLLDYQVSFVASEPQMMNWPGISFGDSGFFYRQCTLDEVGD